MTAVSLGYSTPDAEATDTLPDLSIPKPDVPSIKAFNPDHLCLQEYLKRRLKSVSVNSIFLTNVVLPCVFANSGCAKEDDSSHIFLSKAQKSKLKNRETNQAKVLSFVAS